MAENKATVRGVDHLLRWLGGKPSKAAEKSTRQGITRGARLVLQRQKASAPVRTKLLWKSLGTKIRKYGMVYVAVVGVRRGFRVKVNEVQQKRILAVATRTVKTKTGTLTRSREIKLLGVRGAKQGQYLNPTRYAHFTEKRQKYVARSVQRVEKEIQAVIVSGLRGELR